MEYAKKLTGAQQINTYLGGSHLRIDEVPQSQVDKTLENFKGLLCKADLFDFIQERAPVQPRIPIPAGRRMPNDYIFPNLPFPSRAYRKAQSRSRSARA